MTIVHEIEIVIDYYNKNYKAMTINQLLDSKSKLVTLLCNFADEVAEAKKDSLISTVYRKVQHHKMKSELIEKKLSVSLAESKSIDNAKEIMEQETINEYCAYLHKIKLDQYNRVVDDMMQRISVLRDDQNYHRSIN